MREGHRASVSPAFFQISAIAASRVSCHPFDASFRLILHGHARATRKFPARTDRKRERIEEFCLYEALVRLQIFNLANSYQRALLFTLVCAS